jgi:cbb3-type cytochrome oxidase subunit 3
MGKQLIKMGSSDLAAIGLCLAIAGTFLLAKSIVSKDIFMIDKETGTYFGQNMFQLKGIIFQRYESIIGGIYLILGFLCQLVSIFMAQKNATRDNIFLYSYWNIIFFVLFSILLIWSGYSVARKISLNKYIPMIKTEERTKELNWALFILQHDGWYPEQHEKKDKLDIKQEVLKAHLDQAREIFTNSGLWLDIKQKPTENDVEFANRVIGVYSQK